MKLLRTHAEWKKDYLEGKTQELEYVSVMDVRTMKGYTPLELNKINNLKKNDLIKVAMLDHP